MRSEETNHNHDEYVEYAKIVSALVESKLDSIEHIIWLAYAASLHRLSNTILDADSKLNDLEIEIPFYGCLKVHLENNKAASYEFVPELDFEKELNKTIETGSSALVDYAKKSVGRSINNRYNALI